MIYWDGELVLHNYATQRRAAGSGLVVQLLEVLDDWRTIAWIAERFPEWPAALIPQLIGQLHHHTMIVRSDGPPGRREVALARDGWRDWVPDAAFYHLSTRDVAYGDPSVVEETLAEKGRGRRPPPPLKRLRGAAEIALDAPQLPGELGATLLGRRTWRRFGPGEVSQAQLSTLLGLTWGVQRWVPTRGQGTVALKTSPSGGARHSLEAYVLVLRAQGIEPGLYHYQPDAHCLQRLRQGASRQQIAAYIPRQAWYEDAAVVVLMSAVFARAQWRYAYPRSYRSILLEAGHFCQTFCLLATSLQLAPFCTAALAESAIEADLGLDGVSEAVLYACGVGTRPAGVAWAPRPDAGGLPSGWPPRSARRRK